MLTISRYHDIDCGHRVVGHESKCAHLHGHSYRITFVAVGPMDQLGRIIDFGVVKRLLCEWLEEHWDHRTLIYKHDPWLPALLNIDEHVTEVPFNPTAENMASYLLQTIGPKQLEHTGVSLTSVTVQETRKCGATASR